MHSIYHIDIEGIKALSRASKYKAIDKLFLMIGDRILVAATDGYMHVHIGDIWEPKYIMNDVEDIFRKLGFFCKIHGDRYSDFISSIEVKW